MIDSGIMVSHPQFEGRATWLENFTGDGDDNDGGGYGTWTAGLAASHDFGVSKKSLLFALKVFADDGTTSADIIIAAMDYVLNDAPTRDCPKGHIVNMSFGGGQSQAMDDAANAMVNAGIFAVVAAGNDNVDAGGSSPGRASLMCVVAATDQNDAKASFSNWGSVVDIWAPGVDLMSTDHTGGTVS